METIELQEPLDGNLVFNPDLNYIKHRVLNEGAGYWNAGTGEAYLRFYIGPPDETTEGEEVICDLTIMYEETAGFHLQFGEGDVLYYSHGSNDFSESVQIYIGGNPFGIPRAFFVSRDHAWSVIKQFFMKHSRSKKIKWMRATDAEPYFAAVNE